MIPSQLMDLYIYIILAVKGWMVSMTMKGHHEKSNLKFAIGGNSEDKSPTFLHATKVNCGWEFVSLQVLLKEYYKGNYQKQHRSIITK